MIKWVKKTKLLGMIIDENLSWNEHISELKLNYVNKLNLVKTSRFFPTSVLLDLYFKVILPSITYALVVWGGKVPRKSPFFLKLYKQSSED